MCVVCKHILPNDKASKNSALSVRSYSMLKSPKDTFRLHNNYSNQYVLHNDYSHSQSENTSQCEDR